MQINGEEMPTIGDYSAFKVTVWHQEILQFTLVRKLTRTELSIALNRGCVESKEEALQKLKEFTVSEAKKKFNSNGFKVGEKYAGNYSPCWGWSTDEKKEENTK